MFLKYFIKKKQLLKILYKPHRILPSLLFIFKRVCASFSEEIKLFKNSVTLKSYFDTFVDVKFKKPNPEDLLRIRTNSIQALHLISLKYSPHHLRVIKNEYLENKLRNRDVSQKLDYLFTSYGSDKSSKHNYHLIYAALLESKINENLMVLEIGIGTNNLNYGANMGRKGKPGASLRVFRDFLPNSKIFGADIDSKILFSEKNIETFFIDQLNLQILEDVKLNLSKVKFDLIIDDGLHNTEANFNTIYFALDLLNEKGILLIEDIDYSDLKYYVLLNTILINEYNIYFFETQAACLCIISKCDIIEI